MTYKIQLISMILLDKFNIVSLFELFLLFFRIAELKEIDLAKSRKETSLNTLETAIIETREKLEQPDYASSATDIETQSILDKCSEVIFISFN